MDKISCIIIDDEEYAVDLLETFCTKTPYLNIIGRFTNTIEACAFIDLQKAKIDLVFLDVEMPRFSGIEFLKKYAFPNVILATAYSDYALSSYEYGVIDYLLKPFSFERFSQAVAKAYTKIYSSAPSSSIQKIENEEKESFFVKTERNAYVKINQKDILYIEGAQNYSIIRTVSENIITGLRLKALESQLPETQFIRVHKSHIINLHHLESIKDNFIRLKYVDQNLVVGAAYKNRLHHILHQQMLK